MYYTSKWIFIGYLRIKASRLRSQAGNRVEGKEERRIEERHNGQKAAQTQIPHLRFARSQASLDFVKKALQDEWTKRETGTKSADSYTLAFTSHTPDLYSNSKGIQCSYHPNANGKIGFRHVLCLRKVPGFNEPRCTHAETIIKRYGISYKIAHYIMSYNLQLGQRRGGKSPGRGGLLSGGKCCRTRLSLRKRRSSCWKPVFFGNLKI